MDWISVVDDDESVRAATVDLLSSLGFACTAYASAEEYLGSEHAATTSCLVLDVNMPGMDGLELQNRLKELHYSTPVIFITAFPEEGKRKQAIRAGAVCYLLKPYFESELIDCIRLVLAGGGEEPCRPS